MTGKAGRLLLFLTTIVPLVGCEDRSPPGRADSRPEAAASPSVTSALSPAAPLPRFRNIESTTAYVGDQACASCHEEAASSYRTHAMARSFHRWRAGSRVESSPDEPLFHPPTGFYYTIVEADDGWYQEEFLLGPGGGRLHQLRRRMDHVMGSGEVARTYFTEENGRLFQLPLTWYREGGWDFSPGYEVNNARFGRLMPDRCLACHGSYPEPIPFLEGKYAELRSGIGCERCHGPGALHVRERSAGPPPEGAFDRTIVNPDRLPVERRLDVCEQCHVHTPVTVLREGRDPFDYLPSEPLADHAAFFKATGSIDIVSHADRLRQSACFLAARPTDRPLECATCHDPHARPLEPDARNRPCRSCHAPAALERRLASSPSRSDHLGVADCVACHMPRTKERTVPHGSFTDHWIRVVAASSEARRERRAGTRRPGDGPIEPYFERDRAGPEAEIYRGMGEVVYATLAPDARLLAEAAEALRQALGADTTRADAHFLLGMAYRQLGRTEEAIRALERSVRIDPGDPERLHALARAYESAGRDPSAIHDLYERALELQPALAWIRADHADFLQARGRPEEAERAYRLALEERPSLDVAAFNLGTLLAGSGRLDEASEAFEKSVRLNPALAEALASLLQVRVAGQMVRGVRRLGSPLPSLPVRDRGPGAVRVAVEDRAAGPAVRFVNAPPDGSVRILDPDGTRIRALPSHEGAGPMWDLRSETGEPIAGGLYEVVVREAGGTGRSPADQRFFLGIVRVNAPQAGAPENGLPGRNGRPR